MENRIPHQGEIVWFSCDCEGCVVETRNIPEHMFIILTNSDYNKTSDFICGVPITSVKKFKKQDFLARHGMNITDDDIDNRNKPSNERFVLEKQSMVLCDRIPRLNKNFLSSRQKNIGKIENDTLGNIISRLYFFLRKGNSPQPKQIDSQ